MIVSYCLNPSCTEPQNPPKAKVCQSCGSSLILHNRYRTIKKIGKGGFGATFLALDLSLPGNPFCVIKQLLPATDDPETFQMGLDLFEREAKTLGKIDHPQIPRLLDYFEENHQFYLVQNLVKGKTLQQEVKKKGVFNETRAKRFLVEMLTIIKYVHSLKIIHRDIKPANIICREQDKKLILIDFGAVKDQVNTQLVKTYGQTALTQFSIGTVGFAPPEQLAMRPVYASDLYALGATCLFLMTGKSPKDFPCDEFTGELLWEQQVTVSNSFAKILRKMLEMDVKNRFKSAEEIINQLDIAPYEQELEQSLAVPQSRSDNVPEEDLNSESPDTTYTSATARLAMAIRARKSRQGKTNFMIALTPQNLLMAYANGRNDFSSQNLSKLDLSNANLTSVNFRNCQLIKTNLEEANLSKANLYNSNLTGAILRKANLYKTYFLNAVLENADLRGANLEKADLTGAYLTGANLCGANLTNAKLEDNQLKDTKTNWSTIFPDGKRRFW